MKTTTFPIFIALVSLLVSSCTLNITPGAEGETVTRKIVEQKPYTHPAPAGYRWDNIGDNKKFGGVQESTYKAPQYELKNVGNNSFGGVKDDSYKPPTYTLENVGNNTF